MNYTETIDFLYQQLPMFTRDGVSAFKKNLDNTLALCAHLGNPHQKFKSIHIAGTNGKGSTSHMLAAIFQQSGYKTGLYTSPHLLDFRERIRVDGEMISQNQVVIWVEKNLDIIHKLQPSFFELTVAMAFDCFAKRNVDIAIVEVGLGGLLDSTNVISPEISVVTNVSLDHMNLLGNTLSEIAEQKAGIIKPNIPVIIGEHHPETDSIFIHTSQKNTAPLTFAQDVVALEAVKLEPDFLKTTIFYQSKKWFHELKSDLNGEYQSKNLATVLATVKCAQSLGFDLSDKNIIEALQNVKNINHLMGRWHVLQSAPKVIVDTGHNEAGVKEVIKNIEKCDYKHLHLVLGMVNDKDVSKVMPLFPMHAHYYFCKANLPRSLPENDLKIIAEQSGRYGETFATVPLAITNALQNAHQNDLIFIGGSTFVVAEALAHFISNDKSDER